MSEIIASSSLNNTYINVTFSLEDRRTISAQVCEDFELDDFVEVIRNRLGAVTPDQCYFYVNDQELLLGDETSFQDHRNLITDGCIITVEDPSGK